MADLAELLMDNAIPILDLIVVCLNLLSILVLVWGVVKAGFDFIRFEIKAKDRMSAARENNSIRNFLGSYVLLGLEILIAADIIETIIHPTFADIVRLAVVVVIRTVISYFLNMEIEKALKDAQNNKTDS
ncbi:DUF1622 domain-containing protein [Enterococcus gallinarum]|uniref:DUF1622 domain-containing protein n=1 Tax=Enterococcus gallinarum TaxID=1353 RepID=UPI00115D222B|nr:DUF1622 domain-containing protein [Enterococcus gallinarum]